MLTVNTTDPDSAAFTGKSVLTQADLTDFVERLATKVRHVDPYLAWALLSTRLPEADAEVPLLLEFSTSVPDDDYSKVLVDRTSPPKLYPTYVSPRNEVPVPSTVQPVITTLRGLQLLLDGKTNVPVASIEICQVRNVSKPDKAFAGLAPQPRIGRTPTDYDDWRNNGEKLADAAMADPPQPGPIRGPTSPAAQRLPLVCVVDDRCNFAHPAVANKLGHLWHQGGDAPTLKRLRDNAWGPAMAVKKIVRSDGSRFDYAGAFFGRYLRLADAVPAGGATDEDRVYRSLGYVEALHRWSHGSAVMHLIAGPRVWGRDSAGRAGWQARDHAPSGIRFVQLPDPTVVDTSGGSLASHALDAIRFAVDEAEPDQKVIVNLSYGTHSGGHDGTSLWDRGLCELLNTFDGISRASLRKTLHVVLPAGNSQLMRCHASKRLGENDPTLTLLWKVQPDNSDDSFIEIWLPEGFDATIDVQAPDGLMPFHTNGQLTNKSLSLWARRINEEIRPYAVLVAPSLVSQGRRGRMALLAVAATRDSPEYSSDPGTQNVGVRQASWVASDPAQSPQGTLRTSKAPHGVWKITVTRTKGQGAVHAWVQRGDLAPGRLQQSRGHRGRQSYLLDVADDPQGSPVDPAFTLNGIATLKHSRLHVIGAMREFDHGVSAYSGAGPNRLCEQRFEGPDRLVVADESLNQPGLLIGGMLSGSRLRLGGTSIAAAAYTRLLYEWLAQCPQSNGEDLRSSKSARWTPDEQIPRGSPMRADLMHRGEWLKLLPDDPEGTIRLPQSGSCKPFAIAPFPPGGSPPRQQ